MAPKGLPVRLSRKTSDPSGARETAVPVAVRQAAAATQQAIDSRPEVDRLLSETLPNEVDRFLIAYGKLRKTDDLLKLPSLSKTTDGPPEKARNLALATQHLRDLSWRTHFQDEQSEKVAEIFGKALGTVQTLVTLVGGLDLQASLGRGVPPAAYLGATLLGLEVSKLYCVLASSFGIPAGLVVEEISLGIVHCLKQSIRLITPLLSPESDRSKKVSTSELPFSQDQATTVCNSTADLMQALHEFLSRHKLGEDQLHQLVHAALSIFFLAEPHFRLCAAAEEVLVTIFARTEALRPSILQEFLVRVPRLPSGKRAKKFQIPASEDSADFGLSTWTHLLLRLGQSTCLPLKEPIGANVDFETVLERRPAAQSVITQLTGGLLQRLVFTRSKDEEARAILEDLANELMAVAFKPMWPGAFAMLRSFIQQLVGLLQEKKREAGDVVVREFALKVLSRILLRLWQTSVEVAKDFEELPQWTESLEAVDQDGPTGRLLQHIALRISLEDGRDMPWTDAARAVEAWDANLYLAKGSSANDAQTAGLGKLSDDIVFRYITMAFLTDECTVQVLCPPSVQLGSSSASSSSVATSSLAAAVFGATHPLHTWSFLVCDWAEAAAAEEAEAGEEVKGRKGKEGSKRALSTMELFLASTYCSPTLVTETATWRRDSGGRRILMPYIVYKAYRQMRSVELDMLRKAALDCIIMQANSAQASLRKTAMRALSDLVDTDLAVLSLRPVEETVDMRLRDESSWVRQVSLDLLGRILEGSLAEGGQALAEAAASKDDDEALALARLERGGGSSASAMLLRFHRTVRGRINDTAVIVRRQATKILSAFVLNHPDHPDVVAVTLDLLRRSVDSEALKNLVFGTFELLWFMDDEPTPQAARQLSRVVDASKSMPASVGDLLHELLRRFKTTIGSRKNSKGYEFAIRRWTTLILNEFVQMKCDQGQGGSRKRTKTAKGVAKAEPEEETLEEQWLMRRSLLSTLEAFAAAQPKDLLPHLRPLTIYLALEDKSSAEEQWVAIKICRILSSVLPYVAERRGLMDHRQVQQDLQALIRNQPSGGVHEAVRCLCLVVKYVTGDLPQIVSHLNIAVPSVTKLCTMAEQNGGKSDRIHEMYMSRQAWVLASVLESLSIDDYVQLADVSPAEQSKRRVLPRSELKFHFVGNSVAATVYDILLRLNALGNPQLCAVAVSCVGFFLKGQRGYTKDRRMGDLLSQALSSGDLQICRKALETLASLLAHFRQEAEKESRASAADFGDSRDGRVAGETIIGPPDVPRTGGAVEAAQPLAAFSDAVLAHITLSGSVGPAAQAPELHSPMKRSRKAKEEADTDRTDEVLRVRIEALAVVRHLQTQGLVNPMVVLPKVFALAFAGDSRLADPATDMLKEMLELRPSLLLNRLDEAFREGFLATLHAASPAQPARAGEAPSAQLLSGLGDLYAERFRKQKAMREAFLRKALRELLRLQTNQSEDRFAELAAAGLVSCGEEEPPTAARGRPKSRAARGGEGGLGLHKLPLQQQHQLLYAQFMASALSALPFSYESEPLLLIFECNHHLSLHAGTLLASFEGEDAAEKASSGDEVFAEALSILTCVVLKNALKREYGLSAEQCSGFNPKDPKQEKLKPFTAIVFGTGKPGEKEDGQQAGVRVRFPAAEWLEKVEPLLASFGKPAEIAAYIRKITDADPWDDSRARHADKIDRLEGRRVPTRRKEPPAPPPVRGRGADRGRNSKPAKKYGLRRRAAGEDSDSTFEDPGAKRRRGPARAARTVAKQDEAEPEADEAEEEEDAADID